MTIFGKSRHLKTKTPKTQAACVFLQWNKCLKVECIQMQKLTYGFAVNCITKKVTTSYSFCDVITFSIKYISTYPYVSFCV